ncbi:Uncharacterised protein [Mycobacteroides abscessus subsp. abscessus]|nr:Uncharacterised protein [Mycobacteroides abscessus subsp. abscessus]
MYGGGQVGLGQRRAEVHPGADRGPVDRLPPGGGQETFATVHSAGAPPR